MQIGNTCVFYAMAPGMAYYGKKGDGINLLENFKIGGNAISIGEETSILNSGLPNSLLASAYSQYFYGYFTDPENIGSAILSGYPVIGTYQTGPNMSHDVFITGFSFLFSGGNYAFWNPATGSYGYLNPQVFYRAFVVTGTK